MRFRLPAAGAAAGVGAYAGGGGHSGFTWWGLSYAPLGRGLSVMFMSLAPDDESILRDR
ncbi:hypothetical protein GCM10010293_57470 [Streptomyces griseoflavus]|nr:hypothetical protein GCM10010293_57470 [Streptomyces griseoflavus]